MQWQQSYGGTGLDYGDFVRPTSDGGYIISGMTSSNDGDVVGWHPGYSGGSPQADAWVVKIDDSGNLRWQKTLGGSSEDMAHCVQQTSDGNYVVAGYTYSTDGDVTGSHGGNEYWVVKLDANGNVEWQKTLGGTGLDLGGYVQQTNDGGYIVAGGSYSWDGDVTGNHGNNDYWIVKLEGNGTIPCACCDTSHVTVYDTITTYITVADTLVIPITTGVASMPSNTLKVYPNPAYNHIVIDNGNYIVMSSYSVKITNILGQVVFTQTINQQQFNIDISAWSAGNYTLSVLDLQQNVKVSKMIVVQ